MKRKEITEILMCAYSCAVPSVYVLYEAIMGSVAETINGFSAMVFASWVASIVLNVWFLEEGK